ncbi:MAG: cation transporter [Dehalococcoidia bacterium]
MTGCGCEPVPEPTTREERSVLRVLMAINATMFVVEIVAGWLAQSTGLIADSLDMLADATVYGISLHAVGRSAAVKRRAAFLSGGFQILLAAGVGVEVVRRAAVGSDPVSVPMMAVGALALVANVTCLALLAKHRDGEVHMRASWIFSVNDVLANLGVILGGLLVLLLGSRWPDLAIGGAIALLVLRGGIRILRDACSERGSAPQDRA